jgi:hypothetical protein
MQSTNDSKVDTAKELAENVLAWAKKHNLFSKVPLDEAVDGPADGSFNKESAFRAHAVEEILRKRSINLIGYSEPEKKVIVFLQGKLSKSDEKILPFHIDGFTFEYIQGGIAQVKGNPPPPETPKPFYQHEGRYSCGSSVYPAHCIGAGTLGFLAMDAAGDFFGISNNHVTGACNNAMPGLPILAPGPLDATEEACDPFTIGRHARLLPINDGIPENISIDVNCDAGAFRLTDRDKVTSMQGTFYDTPAEVAEPVPGMVVEKVGRTTGRTGGKIVAISASPVPVQYNVTEYGIRKNVYFGRVYIVQSDNEQPFSKAGDSGSLVVSVDSQGARQSVGLIFAGNEQRALSFILPLPEILQKLELTIVSGHHV